MRQTLPENTNHVGRLLVAGPDRLAKQIELELKRRNYELLISNDHEESLRLLEGRAVHGVVVDENFNNGIDGAFEIGQVASDQGLPCIFVVEDKDYEALKKMANLGVEKVIEGSVTADDIDSSFKEAWENPSDLTARRNRFFDLSKLTPKEKEVACLILKGLSNQEIADALETTLGTIKFYSSQIFEKVDANSRAEFFSIIFPT